MDKLCVLIELISGFCTSQENTQRVTDSFEFFINTYPGLWKLLLEEFYEGKISLSFKINLMQLLNMMLQQSQGNSKQILRDLCIERGFTKFGLDNLITKFPYPKLINLVTQFFVQTELEKLPDTRVEHLTKENNRLQRMLNMTVEETEKLKVELTNIRQSFKIGDLDKNLAEKYAIQETLEKVQVDLKLLKREKEDLISELVEKDKIIGILKEKISDEENKELLSITDLVKNQIVQSTNEKNNLQIIE